MKRILTLFLLLLAVSLGAAPASSTVSRSIMEVSNMIVAPQNFWPTQVFSVPFSNAVNAVVTNTGGGGSSTGGVAVVSGTNIIITTNSGLATINAAVGTNQLYWRTNLNSGITNTGGDVIVKSGTFQVGSGHVFFQNGTASLDNGNVTMGLSSFSIRTNGAADVDTFLTDGSAYLGGGILSYKFWLDTLGAVTITNLAGTGNRFVQVNANGKLSPSSFAVTDAVTNHDSRVLAMSNTWSFATTPFSRTFIIGGVVSASGGIFGDSVLGNDLYDLGLVTNELVYSGAGGLLSNFTNGTTNMVLVSGGASVPPYFTNISTLTAWLNLTNQDYDVSAAGIANGLSTITNNGYPFGVDTPGTTTSGINEKIAALMVAANTNSPGGGDVRLGPGIFYTTDTINVQSSGNATNPFSCNIYGPGQTAGGIVYVGTIPRDVIHVSGQGRFNRVNFSIQNCFVSSLTNAATNMIHLDGGTVNFSTFGGIAKVKIDSVFFGWWKYMTNNPFGFTMERFEIDDKFNLCAVNVDCNFDEPILVENCHFDEVQGVYWNCDHGTFRNNEFINCGLNGSSTTNDWPASSPLAIGAAVTCGSGNGNEVWQFEDNTFISVDLKYYGGGDGSMRRRISIHDQVEGGAASFVAVPPGTQWQAVDPLVTSNPTGCFTNNFLVTNTANFTTWRNQRDTNNLVRIRYLYNAFGQGIDTRNGTNTTEHLTSGFTVDGIITGNGGGLSNAVDLIAGSNVTITTNANNRSFTIASSATSIAGTNIDNYYSAFPSASNTLTLNNGYWLYNAAGDCSVTNVAGQSANKVMWATLAVSNASASAINFRMTGGAGIRAQGVQTTNNVVLASGKMAVFSAMSFGTLNTNYCTISQQ